MFSLALYSSSSRRLSFMQTVGGLQVTYFEVDLSLWSVTTKSVADISSERRHLMIDLLTSLALNIFYEILSIGKEFRDVSMERCLPRAFHMV
jgi:hypothetical protein